MELYDKCREKTNNFSISICKFTHQNIHDMTSRASGGNYSIKISQSYIYVFVKSADLVFGNNDCANCHLYLWSDKRDINQFSFFENICGNSFSSNTGRVTLTTFFHTINFP